MVEQDENFKFDYLPLKKLKIWSAVNVRKTQEYAGIEDLSSNIRSIGVQQPLIVSKINKIYKIISGQRRFIAAGKADLTKVPCLILKKKINPLDAKIISFSENVYRQDMTDEDKANAANELKKKLKTNARVSERLGVSESTVGRYLSWYTIPEKIKKFVRQGKMNSDTAKTIVNKFPDDEAFAYNVAKEYSNKAKEEKSDFYSAIKESETTDDLSQIKKKFKKIRSTTPFKIRLPSEDSKILQELAKENNSSPSQVIVTIITRTLNLYKTGKWAI